MNFPFGRLLAATVLTLCTGAALAQAYPNRPIKLLVGYGAGGSPDAVARLLAAHYARVLGQAVVVENKLGASGAVATQSVAQAPADGYTLLLAESGQVEIAPQLVKVGYDAVKDFTHVGLVTRTPLVMMASAKGAGTTIRNLPDLIAAAKAKPGQLTFATSGIGSGQHLAWEMFKNKAGIDMLHVPYKGATQSVPALIAGEVTVLMATWGSVAQHARAGTMTPIAVASDARLSIVPDLPHVNEVVKGYGDFSSEIGIMAPLGLPPDILARLTTATRSALDDPEIKAKFDGLGLVANWLPGPAYKDLIVQNLKKYDQAIKISKIQPE
jgi:tripartite-type tricarboxylate transporter receptor subunit TctC